MQEIMNRKITIPDIPTGDPFVDAGNLAFQALSKRFPEKTVPDLIEFATDIYVSTWKGKINTLYLNSKITNSAYKGEAKKTETLKLFDHYFCDSGNGTPAAYCRICGKQARLFTTGRDSMCLSGSGAFVNFHHSHEEGLRLCADCITKLFFLPLAVVYLGANLAVLDCSSNRLKTFWLNRTLNKNLDKIGKNLSEGILKSRYSNPVNALFYMASDIISSGPDGGPDQMADESVLFYHFTNFGASPDCTLYAVPNPVFRYMNYVINHCARDWYGFVNRHYHIRQSRWDDDHQCWVKTGKSAEKIGETDYVNNKNTVFERLISNRSILPLLCRFYKNISDSPTRHINILLADRYVMEVLEMKREQIDLIKKIGNVIFDIGKKEDSLKKLITQVEAASKAFQLRMVLNKVVKLNFTMGNREPVCRLDEYVDYLFPDGQYWSEVRDMLLIYLYERMHDACMAPDSKTAESEKAESETTLLTNI